MSISLKQIVKRVVPPFIVKKVKTLQDKQPRIVYNLGLTSCPQPRVFISYVNGFLFVDDPFKCHGTRDVECAAFVSSLIQLGCRVDVARYDCTKGFKKDYDYVIGQGDAFRLASSLNPNAKRILYLTENPPALSLMKEKERIAYFEERHHQKIELNRSGKFFNDEDFERLDACIFIGNPSDSDKIKGIRTFTIRPTGIINKFFDPSRRDYIQAKNRFMWIGSSGVVHKGLDILLDVFAKHPELELYVLGMNEEERRMMSGLMSSNVKNIGYISILSEQFARLAEECGFVILPSCSEGLATSVITGMNHGLIPLVTKETSIEVPVGEVFTDFHVENVEEVVVRWSKKDFTWLKEESEKTRALAVETYNIEKYSERIKELLTTIIINNDI